MVAFCLYIFIEFLNVLYNNPRKLNVPWPVMGSHIGESLGFWVVIFRNPETGAVWHALPALLHGPLHLRVRHVRDDEGLAQVRQFCGGGAQPRTGQGHVSVGATQTKTQEGRKHLLFGAFPYRY